MTSQVVELAKKLVAIPSESQNSNTEICDFLEARLKQNSFAVERLEYLDSSGVRKANLVAKKGEGVEGLGLFSHVDVVPGAPDDSQGWSPYNPQVENGRLIGRGSCDMKGPLAAALIAAADVNPTSLKRPLYLIFTADEEIGYGGASHVCAESKLLNAAWPKFGVIAEPTQLTPVYAHKGRVKFTVTAHGRAAHASTNEGISANFLIAPFLAEMAQLYQRLQTDQHFWNPEFDPPTNNFNMVLDDGGTASNVTAAKTVCTLDMRTMPNDRHQDAVEIVVEAARRHKLALEAVTFEPFHVSPQAEIVQAAETVTGAKAVTVPFGTEGAIYQNHFQAVILGPGDVAQAHTVGEWIAVDQLEQAEEIYRRLINLLCRD